MATSTTTTSNAIILRPSEARQSKQGLQNAEAISAERVGSQGLWMGIITIPPRTKAKAHFHERHETAIYVMQGAGQLWYGEQLQHHATFEAGDFIYIGAGVPHVPFNPSDAEPIITLISRTDPNEQESVVLLPELDRIVE